jgi:hypothetical protein
MTTPFLQVLEKGKSPRAVLPILGPGAKIVGYALLDLTSYRTVYKRKQGLQPFVVNCLDGVVLIMNQLRKKESLVRILPSEKCVPEDPLGQVWLKYERASMTMQEFIQGAGGYAVP